MKVFLANLTLEYWHWNCLTKQTYKPSIILESQAISEDPDDHFATLDTDNITLAASDGMNEEVTAKDPTTIG